MLKNWSLQWTLQRSFFTFIARTNHPRIIENNGKWRGVNSAFANVKQRHRFRTRRSDLANPEVPIYQAFSPPLLPPPPFPPPLPPHLKSSRYKFIAWNIDEPEGWDRVSHRIPVVPRSSFATGPRENTTLRGSGTFHVASKLFITLEVTLTVLFPGGSPFILRS